MCGIIGCTSKDSVRDILIQGLHRLEYRGYDSAGAVFANDNSLECVKSAGRIKALESKLKDTNLSAKVGIAHTRWATHGAPSEDNAHPHLDCEGEIAVVHNGIVENYAELKDLLKKDGHKFVSDTDTEVLSHLFEKFYREGLSLEEAVRLGLKEARGTYGVAVISAKEPDKIVAARLGSPLVIGVGDGENLVASDASALVGRTKNIIYLNDGEMAVLTKDDYKIFTLNNILVEGEVQKIDWDVKKIEKQGFPHFMLKEINEQPDVVLNALRGRIIEETGTAHLGGIKDVADRLRSMKRIIIIACGTSYYAGLVGEYMLEEYAGIPTEVELASEFRYRKPLIDSKTAVLAISQSGETADTLAAIREAKMKGAFTLGIVNAVGSTIARETDAGVHNHAGPEIGVASTKAFVSQLTVLSLITLFLGRQRNMSNVIGSRIASELLALPEKIKNVLNQSDFIKELAEKYKDSKNFLYIGRKYNYPTAMEGALKLKEISYTHSEGYAAGEMKHGPIALIDGEFPVFVIIPKDSVYEKVKSNVEEIRARSGPVIAITTEGNEEINGLADDVIFAPKTLEMLSPIVNVIPLQLFSYHTAALRGFDPDKPRNLAKSVTVE